MTNYVWRVASGNFGAASSWTPSGTPTSADTTNIDESTSLFGSGSAESLTVSNAITVTISAQLTTTIASFTYVGGGNGAPTVDVDAAWSNTGYVVVGGNGSGSGYLYVNAGGSITATELYIGPNNTGSSPSGTGTATVQGGGKVTTDGPNFDEIGGGSGGNGSLTVTGGGSNWTSGQGLTVGDNGAGALTVADDATLDTPELDVGVSYDQPTVASGAGTVTIESGGVVTTTGQYQDIGDGGGAADDAIEGATGAVTVTGAGSEWDAENGEIFVGDAGSKTGSLTISNGGDVTAANGFGIGQQYLGADGSYGALLIDSGGKAVTGGFSNVGGGNSGQPTSTATVTGAGSSWTADEIFINATGKLAVTSGGTVDVTGRFLGLQGGALQVDSDSTLEIGDVGGAALGFLTVDPDPNYDSNLFAEGTIEADVIDNGKIYSNEFDGQGTFVIEGPTGVAGTGTLTGDGYLFVGTQSPLDLAVASVASTLHVEFIGWDTALEIEATGFSAPIQNFNDGDAIDIQGLAYDSGASSYTFTPTGANGAGTLVIKEGASSVTLDIASSPQTISGDLTLSSYAGGAGTAISFTNGAAQSPFQVWSTEGSFFNTSDGTVDGEDYGLSNVTDGGTPIWVETETPASSYVSGDPGDYTLVLSTQDWLGDIQPEITIATDNDLIDPFGPANLGVGNLASATIFSNTSTTGTGGLVYWSASAVAGDYAVDFEPFTISYPSSIPSSNLVTITGSPVTMISAIANPLSWSFGADTSSSLVFAYMTEDTSTTENLYMEGFDASGHATNAAPVLIASGLPDGTPYYVGYDSNDDQYSGYGFRYLQVGGSLGTGLVAGTFNTTTGALGAPTLFLSLPNYTSFDGVASRLLSNSNTIRLIEGVEDGQAVIQSFLNSGSTAAATFDLTSASDHFATASVYDPNTGALDYTVLAYTDAGEVHLELLNETGGQIGADFVVPGISSFLRLNTMQGRTPQASTRVELDYEVADPNGGQEIKGFLFDTAANPYEVTLSGGGLYDGSPFDDTFTWAAGNYTIGGGGGVDAFVVPLNANQAVLSTDSTGDVTVQTYSTSALTTSTGVTTLVDFSDIKMNGSTIGVSQTSNGEGLTISAAGLLQLAGATPAADSIAFSAGGGELAIEGGASLGGTVDNFVAGDTIDLAGLTYNANASSYSVAEVAATDVYDVTVHEGTSSFTLAIEQATPVTSSEFALKPDSGTGTQLLLPVSTWTGAVSSDWNNAANWSPAGVPGVDDAIVIPASPSGGVAPVIANGETVNVYAAITNDDIITLASAGSLTNFVVNGDVTLSGSGAMLLSDNADNRIYSTASNSTLDNQQTIEGAGEIFSNGNLTLDNDTTGVVDATGGHALAVHDITVDNANLLESTSGTGGLSIYNATINNLVDDAVGEIVANGAGTQVDLNNTTIEGGDLVSENGGVIEVTAGSNDRFDGESAPVGIEPNSVVSVVNGANLVITGVIENNGQIQLNATGASDTDLIVNGDVTLKGAGGVVLSGVGTIGYNRIYSTASNSTLDNQEVIEGSGEIFSNGNLTLVNDTSGIIAATDAFAFEIHNITVENLGLLESTGGAGGLEINGATIDNTDGGKSDSGRIVGEGGDILIENGVDIIGGALAVGGDDRIEVVSTGNTLDGGESAAIDLEASVFAIENGANLTLKGAIENSGQIQLDDTEKSDTDLIISGAVTLTGAGAVVMADDGTIGASRIYSETSGSTLDNQQTIQGAGEIFSNGDLTLENDATGVVDATGVNALAVHDITVNNANLLESTSGTGGLSIYNATVNNLLNDDSGEIVADGVDTQVDINNTIIVGGQLVSEGGGALNATEGNSDTLDGANSGAPVVIATGSVLSVLNSAELIVEGTIENDGQVQLDATGQSDTNLLISGDVTLKGTGVVVLSDVGAIGYNRIYSNVGGSTLDNQQTIEGAGEIFSNGDLLLDNDTTGVVDATGAHALAVHDITIDNANLLETTAGAGGLSIYNATVDNLVNDDGGQIISNGAGTQVDINNTTIEGGKLVSENGGVIDATAGSSDTFDGTHAGAPVDITSGSVVLVVNSAQLSVEGTLDNNGELELDDTQKSDTDLIVSGAVTLTGAGTVVMADDGTIGASRIYSDTGGSVLDNQQTIEGAGEIFSNGNLTLDNDTAGVIDATGKNALALHDITVNNAHLLESTGDGGLSIYNATINNLVGDATGEILANGDGAQVDINNTTIEGGRLVSEDDGVIEATAGSSDTFNGASAAVDITEGSVVSVLNSAQLDITGTIENDGQLELNATAQNDTNLLVNGQATLSGAGALVLSDSGTVGYNRIYSNTSGSTLNNEETIEGAGEIFSNGNLSLINDATGVIEADGVYALDIHDISFTNDGALVADNAATLDVANALTNISADANHAGGSVLTGGTYELFDPDSGGESPGGSSTIAISGGVADKITTLDAIVDLTGESSELTSNGVRLASSLLEVGKQGQLNLFYSSNSGFAQNFADPNAVTIDGGGLVNADGATLSTAGLTINDEGILYATGVFNGSSSIHASIESAIANNGVIVVEGVESGAVQPTSYFADPISGTGAIEIDQDALAEFNAGVSSGQTVEFDNDQTPSNTQVAGEETLRIDSTTINTSGGGLDDFAATIKDFKLGDAIDLTNFDDETDYGFNGSTLTVDFAKAAPVTLNLSGLAADTGFHFAPDGDGGTLITLGSGAELANDTGVSATDGLTYDPALVGTGDAGATLIFLENGQSLGTTVVDNNGLWSFTPTGLKDGAQTIDVNQGSTESSIQVASVTFTLATQAPNATASQTLSGLTNKTTDVVSGTVTAEDVAGDGVASVQIVDVDDDVTRSATLGAGGAYSATLTGLSDGAHDFKVVATDNAGNVTTAQLGVVTVATKAPTVNANESVSGTTTATSDVITATATAEQVPGDSIASVLVYDGSTELGAATLSAGTWTYTASNLAQVTHDFSLVTTDAAGNSTTTNLAPVTVAPGIGPTVNASISTPGLTRLTTDTISETATANGNSTISGVEVFDNGVDLGPAAFHSETQTWSFTASGLSDGANAFKTLTTDSAGNQTTFTLPVVEIATKAPINGSPTESVSGLTNKTSVTISVTPTAESVPGDSIASVEIFNTATDTSTAATLGAGGVYSATLSGLSDGAHPYEIITTDTVGNVTTTPLAAVDVATQGPTVNANESVSGTTKATSDVITATATAEQVPGDSIASVLVYDGSTELGAATLTAGTWTYTAGNLAQGPHDFSLVTTDAAGNSTKTTLAPLTVNASTPPMVSANESVSGLTQQTSDTITETATAASGLSISGVEVFDGAADLGAASFNAATDSWSFTAQALSDGVHAFSTVTTDSAGEKTTTTLAALDVATAPPTVTASQSLPGLTNNDVDTITETATAEAVGPNAIESVEIYDDGADLGPATFSAGAWTFTTGALPNGANMFTTVTTDAAGNSTTTALPVVHIATKAPVVKASESVSGLTNQNVVTVSETARAQSVATDSIVSVEVFDGTTDLGAAALSGGVWTFTSPALANGAHDLTTVTTDAAGNVTTSALAALDVATAPPIVTASQSLPALTNQNVDTITETAIAEAVGPNAIKSVEVFDDGTDLGPAAFSDGAWTFTAGALPSGANIFTTTTTDAAGNSATTTLPVVRIATKAPVVKASESASGLTNQNIVTVSETARAQSVATDSIVSVEVFDGATDLGAATLSGGVWTFTTAALADGVHDLNTVTTDAAGNLTKTALAAFEVTTALPTVTASQSLPGLTNIDVDTITETATAEAVGPNAIKSVEIYDDGSALGPATFSNGAWTFTTGALPNGANIFTTMTTDAAGNTATTTLPVVHIATKAPVVKVSESVSGLTNQSFVTISEAARAQTVATDSIVSVEVFDGASDLGAAMLSGGVWTFTSPALANGVHDLSTVTTDAAGNVTTTALAALDVATAPPNVTTSQSLSGLTNNNVDTITETATADTVGPNAIKSVEIYDDGADLGAATYNDGAWTFTTGALPDGSNLLSTVTTDAAGNSATTALPGVQIATQAPVTNASASASGLTNQRSIAVTEAATAEPVAGDAIVSVEVFDGASDLGAATLSNGVWSFATAQLAFGVHDLSTVTTDAAGNATTVALAPVNVEPPAPSVSIALADDSSNGRNITDDDALVGGGDPGATVYFNIDGAAIAESVTADAAGYWTFTPTGLSQGSHTIVASETNGGGTGSATLTFDYETVAPTVNISTPSQTVAFPAETIDGSGGAGTTVQLFDGTQALGGPIVVGPDGLWSENVTLSGSGAHTIAASDTDGAGNVGVSSAIDLFLDTQIMGQSSQTQLTSAEGYDHVVVAAANGAVDALGGDDTVSLASVGAAGQSHLIVVNGGANTLDLSGTGGGAVVDLGLQLATGSQIGANQVYGFQNIIGGAGPETLTLNTAPGGGVGSSGGGSGGGTTSPATGSFIEAGSGDDIMTGASGDTSFRFLSPFGNDTITNFVAAGVHNDIFEVSQSLFANWSALDAALTDTAAGAELTLAPSETVTFAGVTKAALEANAAADFRFV